MNAPTQVPSNTLSMSETISALESAVEHAERCCEDLVHVHVGHIGAALRLLRAAHEPPAVQIGTHPMIDVMLICDAYESGMGQGLKNKPMGEYRNPYDPVHDKHTYRAYSLGYDEGVKRAAQPPPDDAAERLLMFIYNDQFTSPSREAFCRMFDYFQQKGPTATKGDGQ